MLPKPHYEFQIKCKRQYELNKHYHYYYYYSRYIFTFNIGVLIQEIYLFTFHDIFLIHEYIHSNLRDVFIHIQRFLFVHIHNRNISSTWCIIHTIVSTVRVPFAHHQVPAPVFFLNAKWRTKEGLAEWQTKDPRDNCYTGKIFLFCSSRSPTIGATGVCQLRRVVAAFRSRLYLKIVLNGLALCEKGKELKKEICEYRLCVKVVSKKSIVKCR